jgi:hypothetical protein
MRKKLVFMALLFTACASSTKVSDNSSKSDKVKDREGSVLVYQSAANGVADIVLNIKPDNTFSLYMKILPQPMSNDKESIINTSGKWSRQGNRTRLTFKKKKLDVSALFDINYADENQFKIIDERSVDINDTLNELTIWGVLCIKSRK